MDLLDKGTYTESLVDKILVKLLLKDVEVKLSEGSKKGDNYLGDVKRVTIKKGNETSSWIIKLGMTDKTQRELFILNKMFVMEILCYQKIFPTLDRFQEEFNFEEVDKFKHANFLMGSSNENLEVLVMDDLVQYGYRTLERKQFFDWEMLQVVVKAMANFHALSFAMKERNPKEYEKLTNEINENTHLPQHFVNVFTESLKQAKDLISNEQYKERYEQLFPEAFDAVADLSLHKTSDPYNVIIQGDSWIKNIMIKFVDEKPVDMILVDWQMSKITSPVFDLSVILFVDTDCFTRRKYFRKCFDLYYDHLGKKLQFMGCDIAKSFPRHIYEKQIKQFSLYGIFVGMVCSSFIYSEDGLEIADLGKDGADFSHNPESIKHTNEVIEDAVLFDLI